MDNKKNTLFRSTASRISGWFSSCGKGVATDISTTLVSELDVQKLEKEKLLSELDDENLIQVDLCFVLDCTGSMSEYIAAAKNCILKVVEHVRHTNPNVKIWVSLCGYRDHCDGSDRLQIFNFTDSYLQFKNYLNNVKATGGGDGPEDVLGGLHAAVKRMKWRHKTRILLHLGDSPPHGTLFTEASDDTYPNGDPNGLTAENVLEEIKSEGILYYFGKITNSTDTMIQIFRDIIGDFLVFDLKNDGENVEKLTAKLFEAVCSSITTSLTLTSTAKKGYQRKVIEKDLREPDWNTLPTKTGELWHYRLPETLIDIKDSNYFKKKNLIIQQFSYKQAPKPFSSGAERYAYFGLDVTSNPVEKIVIKECIKHERRANSLERCLEMIEVSTVAYFLSTEFNLVASKVDIDKKVNFLYSKILRHAGSLSTRYYTIEPKLRNAEFKRFNVNSGSIKEYRSILEAFAHFTYENTRGYLVVYDLEGIELADQFLLTDPAIQCSDRSRFGRTNLGEKGVNSFLSNHKCDDTCQKLGLSKIS